MTDIDLLGPGDAGAARTLTSSDSTVTAAIAHPDADDTWFADCGANTAGTGTPLVAKFLNRWLQQIRRLVRNSGIPLSNADDDMLGQAIQTESCNWAGTFGGTANALTATLTPVPPTLTVGMRVVAWSIAEHLDDAHAQREFARRGDDRERRWERSRSRHCLRPGDLHL